MFPIDTDLQLLRQIASLSQMHPVEMHPYLPQPSSLPITLIRAEEEVKSAEMHIQNNELPHPLPPALRLSLGWEEVTSSEIKIHKVPGTHRELAEEPNVQVLAAILRGCIDAIE